jgi:DNA polymerase-3 subunit alpha
MSKVKESGMNSVTISDHGVMYGVPEFWFGAKDFGLKPIIGCEIYLSPDKHSIKQEVEGIKYYHLLLIAKNRIGYQNLNKLISIAHTEGYYYKPRVDKETLAKYSEGLICTSACLAGPVSRHISKNQPEKASLWIKELQNTFKDDFYLEVQRNGFEADDFSKVKKVGLELDHIETIKQQINVNKKIREFSEQYNIPIVATTDAHYLNEEDKDTQEILFAIKDGRLMTDPGRRRGYIGTYVKTPDEMKKSFEDNPEVLENTMKISEKVENYDIAFDRIQPKYYNIPKGKSAEDELREQVFEGAQNKYGKLDKELEERIKYELKIIHDKGYDDYILVVADIMQWARSRGIVVGVRGSVAGSVAAYCLDIINVEPISWELYFERFLNPERPSPPDIDMDIQDDRRDEIIEYVAEKYGKDNVVAICAIGRMKTKAAIRDVARVMNIDLGVADKLSKKVHVVFGKVKKISQMMQDDNEFKEIIESNPDLQRLKKNVENIEGMARHISTHACGYLITPEPIVNYVSIQKESKGGDKLITQNEGTWIEALGLMKFDFLGLRNLTIIKNTLDFIKKYHGKTITVW